MIKRSRSDDFEYSLLAAAPTMRQRQLSVAAVALMVLVFIVVAPIGATQFPPNDGFIPVIAALIFVSDVVTAVLLFNQFTTVGSRALLVLASGYLFTGLIVIPHALSFPSTNAPTGFLSSGIQATPWLYTIWHFALPVSVISYALLKRVKHAEPTDTARLRSAVGWSVVTVVVLVCAATLGVILGHDYLPPLMNDGLRFAWLSRYIAAAALLATGLALALLWFRRNSVLDLWLMVTVCALVGEFAVNTFVIGSRFSLAFYTSRAFSVVVSTTMLIILLRETTGLYARLALANRALRRERDSGMINVEAVAASLAHEVRQPLAAIVANGGAALNFLNQTPPDHREVADALRKIVSQGHRASEVFQSIRALFKDSEQGSPIDINDIITEALRILRGDLEDQGVAVHMRLASDLPHITGHRVQLQEVVLNLVQNAIDAMATVAVGTRKLEIETARDGHGATIISVEDSGTGITPEKIERIFDAFVSTKPKGMGLGLAISEMIVERHGGTLSASSGPGAGARFEISLPAEAAAPAN